MEAKLLKSSDSKCWMLEMMQETDPAGDFGVEVESVHGDRADTKRSLTAGRGSNGQARGELWKARRAVDELRRSPRTPSNLALNDKSVDLSEGCLDDRRDGYVAHGGTGRRSL